MLFQKQRLQRLTNKDEIKPLTPEQVDALERDGADSFDVADLIATVHDRERQRDEWIENSEGRQALIETLLKERDELQRQLDEMRKDSECLANALRLTDALLIHRQGCPIQHQPPEECDCGIQDTKAANVVELRRICWLLGHSYRWDVGFTCVRCGLHLPL